jgi:hypothetical protein
MMFRNTPSRPIQSPHHAADGAYGGCRRADFGSALFRLDAPQPARDPGYNRCGEKTAGNATTKTIGENES